MWDSDSDDADRFTPAVLNRPKVANHIVHESFTVDTRDHEDHTFCGMMFDIACRGLEDGGVPLEYLSVEALSIRGDLGPITVWSTPDSFERKQHDQAAWELMYEGTHTRSYQQYQKLDLPAPIKLASGESRGIYVHSKLPGDEAIVYDNQRDRVTYEDRVFRVLPGIAHLSNQPFGRRGMWGFPWRERREFVGRFHYGVSYRLWNPEVHGQFPADFRRAVETLLLCARRTESPMFWLQDEVVFYILNLCRYDWFQTAVPEAPPPQSDLRTTRPRGLFSTWMRAESQGAPPTRFGFHASSSAYGRPPYAASTSSVSDSDETFNDTEAENSEGLG